MFLDGIEVDSVADSQAKAVSSDAYFQLSFNNVQKLDTGMGMPLQFLRRNFVEMT